MPSQVAAALYRAHKGKFTGHLNLTSGDRTSQLMVAEGDVVGARVGFGHQTVAQALLVTGAIGADALDALWARGEAGRMEPDSLEGLTTVTDTSARQVLASVRRMAELAEGCAFVPTPVEAMFPAIPGARAVRTVFELEPSPDRLYRCSDPKGCEPWVLNDGDRALLLGLEDFRKVTGLPRDQWALLKILEHAGKVDVLSEEEWEARRLAEERRQEEARRAEAEKKADEERRMEEARQAEERRIAAEREERARQAEEERLAQEREEARRAEEARLAEERAEQARQAEEARLAEERAEQARQAEEARLAEERAEEARQAEEARLAKEREERAREAEEERLAQEREEQARKAEEQRLAAERAERDRRTEERRLAAERAEEARLAQERQIAEARAEEQREAEAQQRLAEERAEAARQEEALRQAEEARLAEEARRAEAERAAAAAAADPSWGDFVPGQGQGADPNLAPQLAAAPEEMPTLTVDDLTEPAPEPAADEATQMEGARLRAQADRVREMNEALLRAGAGPVDDWLAEPASPKPAPPVETASPNDPETARRPTLPGIDPHTLFGDALGEEPSLWSVATPSHAQPLVLGKPPPPVEAPAAVRAGGDEDLWKIVDYDRVPAEDASSFEEALSRVDASLEQIIGMDPPQGIPVPELPVEAIVEAVEPAPARDNADWTHDTPPPEAAAAEDEDWPFEDDLSGDPSDPAEAARLRRQRLLRRAMENLGTLGRAPGTTHAEPVPEAPATPSPSAAAPAPSSDELALARQIEERHALLDRRADHFALLAVTRQSTKDQIKAAYLSAAKTFHPDRLPGSLQALAPKMTAVFEAIRDAYETLRDDARRIAYVTSLDHPAAPTARAAGGGAQGRGRSAETDAAEAYKMGEVLFRKRDYAGAEGQFERAYSLDAKATYMAAKAWAVYMDPARKAQAAAAKQAMVEAATRDPECDRAHYQLGVIARVEGDMDRAERHFREAIRANPRHLEANQELRLIEMRKKNSGKRGLFG